MSLCEVYKLHTPEKIVSFRTVTWEKKKDKKLVMSLVKDNLTKSREPGFSERMVTLLVPKHMHNEKLELRYKDGVFCDL